MEVSSDRYREAWVRRAVERFFRLSEHGTTFRTEVLGGTTTFATMAYIIVVNPAILQFAGLPVGPSTVATILTAAVGSLLMGLYANRPLAVAPYMGENAFIAFGLAAWGSAGRCWTSTATSRRWNGRCSSMPSSCMFSALVGSSTSGAYIESAAGVREGARTGLAAVMTALLFARGAVLHPAGAAAPAASATPTARP